MSNLFSSLTETLGIGSKEYFKLESALANFFQPEILDGKERYYCEDCKEFVVSTKTLSIKELPQVNFILKSP